jgi:hypothetical protein
MDGGPSGRSGRAAAVGRSGGQRPFGRSGRAAAVGRSGRAVGAGRGALRPLLLRLALALLRGLGWLNLRMWHGRAGGT